MMPHRACAVQARSAAEAVCSTPLRLHLFRGRLRGGRRAVPPRCGGAKVARQWTKAPARRHAHDAHERGRHRRTIVVGGDRASPEALQLIMASERPTNDDAQPALHTSSHGRGLTNLPGRARCSRSPGVVGGRVHAPRSTCSRGACFSDGHPISASGRTVQLRRGDGRSAWHVHVRRASSSTNARTGERERFTYAAPATRTRSASSPRARTAMRCCRRRAPRASAAPRARARWRAGGFASAYWRGHAARVSSYDGPWVLRSTALTRRSRARTQSVVVRRRGRRRQ